MMRSFVACPSKSPMLARYVTGQAFDLRLGSIQLNQAVGARRGQVIIRHRAARASELGAGSVRVAQGIAPYAP
jgi:hypothetical protein